MQLKRNRLVVATVGLALATPLMTTGTVFAQGNPDPNMKQPSTSVQTEVVDNLDSLKSQLKELQKDPIANKDKITELEAKITKLEEQIKPVDDKAVQEKLEDVNGKVAVFETQFNKFQPTDAQKADVEKLKGDLAKIKQALKDISADKKSDAKTKLEQLDAQETNFAKVNIAFAQIVTPQDESDMLTKRLDNLLKRVDSIKSKVNSLSPDKVDKATLTKLNQAVKDLQQQAEQTKTTVKDAKANEDTKTKALDTLEQKCSEIEKEVTASTSADQKDTTKFATALLKRIEDLKFKMNLKPVEDHEVSNAVGKYTKQLDKYESMVKDVLKSKSDETAKISQLKKIDAEINKIEDSYAELIGQAEKEVSQKSKAVLAEIDKVQDKLDKYEPKTDKQKEEKQKLVDQLKELREKVNSTVASKTTSKQDKLDALKSASKEVKKLDKKVDELTGDKDKSEDKKDKGDKLAKTGDPMSVAGGTGLIASLLGSLGLFGKKKFF